MVVSGLMVTGWLDLVPAALIAWATVPLLVRASARLGLVDVPSARSTHDRPVARVGGIAILLGGSKVGEGCVIGAGAVVLENAEIPPYSLVVGAPGKVIRKVDGWERASSAINHANHYVEQARKHCEGEWDGMVSC